MGFENAIFLYLMLPPLGILSYFVLSGSYGYEKYFSPSVLDKILIRGDALGTKGRNTLLLLALFMMIIALSRPYIDKKQVKVAGNAKNLIILVDISRSMEADDIYPSRLKFVKHSLEKLIDSLQDTNIGIVAFAKNAFLVSPVTSDKKSLKFLLSNLSSDMVSAQGTDIANALKEVAKMLAKGGIKDVFLISDGGENAQIQKAIKVATKHKLKVNIMVVGSAKGGSIRLRGGELLKDKNGDIVISKRNEKLKELAFKTGGVYIKEFGSAKGVNLLSSALKKQKTKEEKTITDAKELFIYPLSFAFVLIFIALHGRAKNGLFGFLAVFLLFDGKLDAGVLDFIHLNKAQKAIEKKDYQKAIEEYNKLAQTPQVTYNKANAYYKMKKYDEALSEYKKIKSKDKDFKSYALFNEGNAHVQKKQYKEALKAYEIAKKLTPNDKDIDKNIEYVKKLMQKKKDKKQDNKKNDKQNSQQNQDEQNKDKQQNKNSKEEKKKKAPKKEKNEDQNQTDQNQSQAMQQSFADANESFSEKEAKKYEMMIKQKAYKTKPLLLGKKRRRDDEITW